MDVQWGSSTINNSLRHNSVGCRKFSERVMVLHGVSLGTTGKKVQAPLRDLLVVLIVKVGISSVS